MKILLSSVLVFPLLVLLASFCEFLMFVHLHDLGSLLSKISRFLFIIVEDLRRGLAGKHQGFDPRCVEGTEQ